MALRAAVNDKVVTPRGGPGARPREIYERIRSSIMRGELRPNEPLIEADLAEQLGVSRTPIREGLQRLATDGLIVARRRGWAVREHSEAEIRQIYEVRAALEGYAARLAAERSTPEELDRLEALGVEGLDVVTHPDDSDIVVTNDTFHDQLVAAAHNPLLAELVHRSCQYHFNYRIALTYSHEHLEAAVTSHLQLVEAVRAGDADCSEVLTREHIAVGLNHVLRNQR
jgi:DNA-binding GntR family transcriptional regulator